MSGPMKKLKAVALAIGLAMAGAGTAQAVTLSNALVGGPNDLLDESRETYVDANANGLFDVGDVIFGYIRISDAQPKGAGGNNQIYGVFSQQIIAGHPGSLVGPTGGRNVFFGPTTVAGLTLTELLGNDANVGSSALAAFYDKPAPYIVDLVNNNPPGPPADMPGYIDYIRTNGTLRLVAGFTDVDDFLYSEIALGAFGAGIAVGGSNAPFVTALSSFTLASNFGAFSVQYQDALPYIFQDIVPVIGPLGLVLAEVGISSGATGGADGASVNPQPKNWLNAGAGHTQCTVLDAAGHPVDTDCGFTDKNNFTVNVIPEPGTLALASVALLAAGGLARRRRNLPV